MNWVAVIPLKRPGDRKTRLAGRLDEPARTTITDAMLERVVAALADVARIRRVELLCGERPTGWSGAWRRDEGRGLNAELNARLAADRSGPVLILHADLPLVAAADIEALLDAAERHGLAIAPDRRDSGTNALALADARSFTCCFGADSFRLHEAGAGPRRAIVRRPGLSLDCDTPDDLDHAISAGFDAA